MCNRSVAYLQPAYVHCVEALKSAAIAAAANIAMLNFCLRLINFELFGLSKKVK